MPGYAFTTLIVASSLSLAGACHDETDLQSPGMEVDATLAVPEPLPVLGSQWERTVVDYDAYAGGLVAANHRLFVTAQKELGMSEGGEVVAYGSDGAEQIRVPISWSGGISPFRDGLAVRSHGDHWVKIQPLDDNLVIRSELEVPVELYVRDLLEVFSDRLIMLDEEADPVDGPEDKYYMKLYDVTDGPDDEPDLIEQWVGHHPEFYKMSDMVQVPSGDMVMCEEITGSLWRLRPGVGLVDKLTFWQVEGDTAYRCRLIETSRGLVATWIGKDGEYGVMFDDEGTRILWGPEKFADDNGDSSAKLPGVYVLLDDDTLVGIDQDDFSLTLTALTLSDSGLRFSRQYDVAFAGPQVLSVVIPEVMDGALYLAYTNSTFSDNIVTLAKLDPLPE